MNKLIELILKNNSEKDKFKNEETQFDDQTCINFESLIDKIAEEFNWRVNVSVNSTEFLEKSESLFIDYARLTMAVSNRLLFQLVSSLDFRGVYNHEIEYIVLRFLHSMKMLFGDDAISRCLNNILIRDNPLNINLKNINPEQKPTLH